MPTNLPRAECLLHCTRLAAAANPHVFLTCATFRVHVVTGDDPIEQMAFLSLWGVDAAVYIPSGKTDAAAAKAMTKHFATYGQPLVLVAAAKPVPGIEGLAVPPTGAPLADAIEREIVEAFRAKRIKGRTTTPPTKAYTTRAKQIADAADIALGLGPPKLKLLHESTKAMALHPGLGFATTSSLHTLESALFEYWKGTKGVHVTKFWAQVAERKLPFTR